ncbi:uncharacterized protein Z518_02363 [Rhinocladiella mackenziei CBS 650.93]|uniref:DNA-directed RNA polymerase subunit n=1 Tax=Rhinocladiella mackenziei CBS 650.93 TaxID=1442369 RepID=A0A0D2IPB3_9EURO|nr:uncharacterized protein Z518_02363 [Rhinocladiella mackenziei CBS 650.93]KIX07709.1 hypothetical protein Z518_02363 [Rhinocladiella mackenziei CBS 650.93]
MSVQVNGKHVSASKKVESLTTPKKRKHDTEERESSKKKKKQRREIVANPSAATLATSTEEGKKKKKKRKNPKDETSRSTRINEEALGSQDIELPETAEEPNEVVPQTSSTAVNGEDEIVVDSEEVLHLLDSQDLSSFYSTRLSLYLSIPAIALEASSSSILAMHLAPLLLTYFPPAKGVVLGFSDPVLSAKPDTGINLPLLPPRNGEIPSQGEVWARTADEFGVCWIWLTATFLVFRPQRGDELYGWTNVASEGFVGLVSYNYFQTAVGKPRIPADWNWHGPTKEQAGKNKKKAKKGRLRDGDGVSQAREEDTQEEPQSGDLSSFHVPIGDDVGFFADSTGSKISETLKFRVVDTEMVPAHDRHKWALQIDGTLLDEEAERQVVEEERAKFEQAQQHRRSPPPRDTKDVLMSGALRLSREGSVASRISGQTPGRHWLRY